jgi:RNA polymerase sigma factor (sigma-70 family)
VGNRRTAAACLSLLNEEERLLMWLHFVEGLTQEEVAEVAGLSRKTVNERLGLIRRRLSDWLSAPGARHA